MSRKEKSKGGSIISLLMVAVIWVLQFAGRAGVTLIVALFVLGLVGFVIWQAVAASSGKQQPANRERASSGGTIRPVRGNAQTDGSWQRPVSTPPYRSVASRPAVGQTRAENARRIEMFKDLLEAGIIDKAEYYARTAELETEGR